MPAQVVIDQLFARLRKSGFQGEMECGYGERVVAATDNSIYQLAPAALLYPKREADIQLAMQAVYDLRDSGLSLTVRGGGTGTNGQSLSDNVVLDCGRHLNRIIDFDAQRRTVTVQPGVVLDQLNEFLEPHGLFFPIDISSSSRATLGGMVATDASGKGSLIYGKTSNHIESLLLVLANGSEQEINALSARDLQADDAWIRESMRPLYQSIEPHRDKIDRIFPDMNRGLTGYNLQHALTEKGGFNPCFLLAGAEGTLAIVQAIRLRVLPRPRHRLLAVVFYEDFLASLRHVQFLLTSQPAAIEMLDDKILNLARADSVWYDVQSVLDLPADKTVRAANFIEFVGHDELEIEQQRQRVEQVLQQDASRYTVILARTETDPAMITALWSLRKRAVGLLGRLQDDKRGIAFVEDSAVPSHNLTRYVTGFRQLLDEHGLDYGMYGHADAGVLHVRPALNLMQARDRELIRIISDQVAQLAHDNGGVLWGEHGRGFRGEYGEMFFGDELYPLLARIKYHFDPYNLLNPGKLVSPDPGKVVIAVDAIPLRGALDEQIGERDQQTYLDTLYCNGNGACFNVTTTEAMCPSYKATRNKLYSPKGRAAMLREWARLQASPESAVQLAQLEHSLLDSLQHCLSCKSCSASCPLKVDIPELKSRFLEHWHASRSRPWRDLFSRHFETLVAIGGRYPALANGLTQAAITAPVAQRISGLNRLPRFSRGGMQACEHLPATHTKKDSLSQQDVILLRDNYLHSFDRDSLASAAALLQQLGYRVFLSDVIHNGKLLHVKGMRGHFHRQARSVVDNLRKYQQSGATLVGIETMTRLLPQKEYLDILREDNGIRIRSVEALILDSLAQQESDIDVSKQEAVTLLPHCLEQTTARESMERWRRIFALLGIELEVRQAGCCGMSGVFGHEVANNQLSDDIFNLYWKGIVEKSDGVILATGFSCRCQLKNQGYSARHPVQYLHDIVQSR